MTVIDLTIAFTGDDLLAACATLGLRRPVGLTDSMARHPTAGAHRPVPPREAVALSDGTAAALAVLAAPEAIAVVERTARARKCVTYVAVRGPWGALHRIHGDHHVVESLDAEHASLELLAAAGLGEDRSGAAAASNTTIDVTRGAFERMVELVGADDLRRAAAALEAEGAAAAAAATLSEAARSATTHVLGLRSVGLRYEGCELAWIGDGPCWLAPLPARSVDTGTVTGLLGEPRHLRVRIEPVDVEWLGTELARVFG